MNGPTKHANSGITGFDKITHGLRLGDNVVWQVDSIADYKEFVSPFVDRAVKDKKRIVYIRFAQHEPVISPSPDIITYNLDAYSGFESFSGQLYNIIKSEGVGVYYVFDCLSELQSAWATDLMIGNFFMITCPYLFELDTVTYFAILRNNHSYKAVARIRETTQLLIDVYNIDGSYYVHPLKVWNRYSPTMFLPHLYKDNDMTPLNSSLDTSRIFEHIYKKGVETAARRLDYWDRLFMKAQEMVTQEEPAEEQEKMVDNICRIMLGRDERILSLAKKHFSLQDLLNIKDRLIGTGFIGGKTVGMLLARQILLHDTGYNWQDNLESHDSFYIGSDVFYTYIVQNGWWKLWMQQKTSDGYFSVGAALKEKMSSGFFPEEIREQFQRVVEYYGQAPVIIRSSSLLEDSFGNAFAGKYESIFSVNQGDPDQRYAAFEKDVKHIFSTTMNEDALAYRLQRGLDRLDEQMALLVQRVSGSYHANYFFPDMAGVGISYNVFLWKENMDPKAGMVRLVFGLGTRAVNRVENDYPRIIALDMPFVKPHAGMEDTRKFSQREVDLLNITDNQHQTVSLADVISASPELNLSLVAVKDAETTDRMRELGIKNKDAWLLTFDELLEKTDFTFKLTRILKILEVAYEYPVEIEFTANFVNGNGLKINLLQCRPFQGKQNTQKVEIADKIDPQKTLFRSKGFFMGGNISQLISRVIYVDSENYSALPIPDKYQVARIVGKINKQVENRIKQPVLLLGPGRWGTSTPSLGVPVSFGEINNFTAIVEISYMHKNLMPELSFGTHFFQDLVETDIFYIALFIEKQEVVFNRQMLASFNDVTQLLVPGIEKKFSDTIKVYDTSTINLSLMSDIITQNLVCFVP
jgi:hypothetical protein